MLQELAGRYGLQAEVVGNNGSGGVASTGGSGDSTTLSYRLEVLREHIRKQIRKELKIKEGAENLKKVTTGELLFFGFENRPSINHVFI